MLYICSKYRPFSNRCSVASSFGLFPVVLIGDEMRCVHEAEVTLTEVSKSSISSGNQQSDFVVLLGTFRQLPTLESPESTAHLRQPSIIMHTKLWVSRTMYLTVLRLPDSERICNGATSPRTRVFVRSTAVHGRDVLGASESKSQKIIMRHCRCAPPSSRRSKFTQEQKQSITSYRQTHIISAFFSLSKLASR